jgi:hypothetical protein
MNPHRLELADIFRTHQKDFRACWNHVLSRQQKRALRYIRGCRTAVLGGHLHECDRCGHRVILYNSCRNRHCPKCQATARARWLAQRQTELLPVPYFQVVFTLPQQIGRLAMQNAKPIYNILFRAASQTLVETAADPRLLGASIGFLAVLHTWVRICIYIRTCIASYPEEASHRTAPAGSAAPSPPSFFPSVCSAAASARSSCAN